MTVAEARRVLAQIPGAGEMSDEAVARFEEAIRTIAADEFERRVADLRAQVRGLDARQVLAGLG